MDDYTKPCDQRPKAGEATFEPNGADAAWIKQVADDFTVFPRDDGYVYTGLCPRCCHLIDVPIDKVYGAADATIDVTLVCNCHAHKSEDAQLPGCGRFGTFTLSGIG